ncbi:MAG TPA: hexose kinase [Bryobacteraceae bacterium]|nr:hexose kinase [Bryobacteraceae bacterium]
MILTLTLNPAIDRNVTADKLVFEDRAYILTSNESAGGRGINASHLLNSFGATTLAIAISGGRAGKLFEEFLAKKNYPSELIRIRHNIRTNITIADRNGLAIKLNERGPELLPAEVARVEKAVCGKLSGASWLMLCGSLPPGVPADFYARLVRSASKRGVPVLVDADGDALLASLEEHPTVVAPNQPEAERLLDRALITRAHFVEAARRIHEMGAGSVVLSLGARGAIGVDSSGGVLEAIPPRIEAICPIGAGDALAAALIWSLDKGEPFGEALRWGVAAGTASARLPGVGFPTLDQTRDIRSRVEIRAA